MYKFIEILYTNPAAIREDKHTGIISDAFNCFNPDIDAMVEDTVSNYDRIQIEPVVWAVIRYFAELKTQRYVDGRIEYAANIAEALTNAAPEVDVSDDIRYFTEQYLPRVHAPLRQAFAGYVFAVIRKLAEQAGDKKDIEAVRQTRYYSDRDSDEQIARWYPRCPMV